MEYINMDKRFKISKILLRNLIFLLLFALLINKTSTFGFDSATSCSPNAKQSRRGRAQMLATIPCDLTEQAYCTLPGAAYPWHAVRRFVHENQGLMKRMYGDVRHISVLRDEILNNEIDVDDIESASERYSRDGFNHRASKFMHNREEFDNFKPNDVLREPHFRPVTTTTTKKPSPTQAAITSPTTTERVETTMPANDVEKPTTPGTTTTTLSSKTMDQTKTTTANEANTNFDIDPKTNPATDLSEEDTTKSNLNVMEQQEIAEAEEDFMDEDNGEADINIELNSVYESPSDSSSPPSALLGDNIEIVESPQLGLVNITIDSLGVTTTLNSEIIVAATASSTATTTTTSTTIKPSTTTTTTTTTTTPKTETVAERSPAKQQRKPFVPTSHKQRPQQLHKVDSTISAKLKLKLNPTQATPTKITTTTISSGNNTVNIGVPSSSTMTAPLTTTKASPFKGNFNKNYNRYTTINNNRYGLPSTTPPTSQQLSSAQPFKSNAELLLGEKIRKPVANSTPVTLASNRPVIKEGQLFQDTMKQEPAPIINARGVNACPVKEEVIAPFWANNTRGEILALLNLYPFEQYVHWEKCTHEHKQMYCREGCRCEQQYRLHRLLAYDPHNECRGIFSDWFRFPSCCICKCYNIPLDFRATSRSPRAEGGGTSDARHPIEVAEEQVKNAIYEHATEDWYRPKEEFDLYEG